MCSMDPTEGIGEDCRERYRLSYIEKRKVDNRERVRRCRAKKAALRELEDSPIVACIENSGLQSAPLSDRTAKSVSTALARELAVLIAPRLRSHDPIVQQLTIEKLLGQHLLVGMVPDFLVDTDKVKLRHSVMSNLKGGMTDHLLGARQSKIVMAKDIVCTLASSSNMGSNMGSNRRIADLIGVDRRNLKRGMERRLLLDTRQNAFWLNYRSKRRSDALSDSVKEVVIEFWTSETTVSPNRKDIIRHRNGVHQYSEHPAQYLQVSEVSFDVVV